MVLGCVNQEVSVCVCVESSVYESIVYMKMVCFVVCSSRETSGERLGYKDEMDR